MWEATKTFLKALKDGIDKGADSMTMTFEKEEMISISEELSRLTYSREIREILTEMRAKTRRIRCLYDTADPMVSKDYKERFYAEYWQLKIRYEKLKKLNTRIEAANRAAEPAGYYPRMEGEMKRISMPKHDCPEGMLRAQQCAMEEYLHILELRAVIEGIDLNTED